MQVHGQVDGYFPFFGGRPVLMGVSALMALYTVASDFAANDRKAARSTSLFLAATPPARQRCLTSANKAYSVSGMVKLSRISFAFFGLAALVDLRAGTGLAAGDWVFFGAAFTSFFADPVLAGFALGFAAGFLTEVLRAVFAGAGFVTTAGTGSSSVTALISVFFRSSHFALRTYHLSRASCPYAPDPTNCSDNASASSA